jgi:hypothetical protein
MTMIKGLILVALLAGAAPLALGQSASHLDPGQPPADCTNCQQIEQSQSKEWATPSKLDRDRHEVAAFTPQVSFTNNSSKKIKRVIWTCTFRDHVSGETITDFRFVSQKKIVPGQSVVLKQKVFIPMSQLLAHPRVIQVGNEDSPASQHRVEQTIQITEIRYTDGSLYTP